MKTTAFALLSALTVAGCGGGADPVPAVRTMGPVTETEARAIARDAYTYAEPIVDGYRICYAYFVNRDNPEFKAPWNTLKNIPRVFTPEDKAVQSPNSDTPYSSIGLDLRAEPMVLTVPAIETRRYYSIQLIDTYTHNFDYIGSRATGNEAGSFLIAGPGWTGETPKGIKKVIRSETDLNLAIYRTQLFEPHDLENVKKIQEQYKAQPLSAFLGRPAPAAAPEIAFIKPLTPAEQKTSLDVFSILNFVLQFGPTHPSETEQMARFAKIGIGPGKRFDAATLSPEMKTALEQGIADAWADHEELKKRVNAGQLTSNEVFGTREKLKNNYQHRMMAAVLGIYGNSAMEAMYPSYLVDQDGKKLEGANPYKIRFAPGQLPPVNGFWSLTMYELPSSLMLANPLNRYLINSQMLPHLRKDADGGVTLLIQNASPGKDKESNWLPAPTGPYWMAMRLYWPKQDALNGTWKQPALQPAN